MKKGNLVKMGVELDEPVRYQLRLGDDSLPLNERLGKTISLTFTGTINCTHCGVVTKKSYGNGYCYPCTTKLAQCDLCILKPELCHFAAGTCREPEWGEKYCMIPHYVYLANSSGLKVGITRHTQVPTRWIDQGAVAAIPIFKVGSRYFSGRFEKLLAESISDKTNWRNMLKGEIPEVDLEAERDRIFEETGEGLDELEEEFGEDQVDFLEDGEVVEINYPVLEYPKKVTSLNFDKTPTVEGTLLGIKGQYLILDTGVINIRRHTGYEVEAK